MKNIRNYLLLSLLICGLVACSDDETPSSDSAETPTPSTGVTADPGVTDVPGVSDDPGVTPTATTPVSCNIFAQTGCADGEKCAFVVDGNAADSIQGHVSCVADGTVALDGACTLGDVSVGSGDICQAGLACDGGTCRAVCSETNPNCANNGSCVAFNVYPDFNLCLASCGILEQNCNIAGEACYATGPTSTACAGEGILNTGDTCGFVNDCMGGQGCFGEDDPVCRKFCDSTGCLDDVGNPNACGCGQCGPADVCFALPDSNDGLGICLDAVEIDCDCTSDPVCG